MRTTLEAVLGPESGVPLGAELVIDEGALGPELVDET